MLESNIHDRGRKQARSNLGVFAHILAQSTIAEHKRKVVKISLQTSKIHLHVS
jgi:hypothetical protein